MPNVKKNNKFYTYYNDIKRKMNAYLEVDPVAPLCALGEDTNKTEIWKFEEMEADYVKMKNIYC
ncbi:MAG: hypothetical protein SNJ71_07610 [Bacteroidales bacterium]